MRADSPIVQWHTGGLQVGQYTSMVLSIEHDLDLADCLGLLKSLTDIPVNSPPVSKHRGLSASPILHRLD